MVFDGKFIHSVSPQQLVMAYNFRLCFIETIISPMTIKPHLNNKLYIYIYTSVLQNAELTFKVKLGKNSLEQGRTLK